MNAQLPDCDKYYRYLSSSDRFQTVDPSNNNVNLNSIVMPNGSSGLAVANNLSGGTPSPTFYTLVNDNYYYYDGNSWVNTGHFAGSGAAVNPGGSGPYIYNIDGLNSKLYRYDGTGPGTLFLDLGNFGGPFDVMGDADGNVYVLQSENPQALNMYDPNANLICSYDLVNLPTSGFGGGYSIVNGVIYAVVGSTLYEGIINGNTITFTPTPTSESYSDLANCPFPPINLTFDTTDDLTCSVTTVQISASTSITNPQYSWSGPGIVSGGNTATPTIDQPGTYTLTVTSSGSGGCSGTATQDVVVNQTSGLTINSNVSATDICASESSTLDVTGSGGTAPYTYDWDNGLPSGTSNTVSPTSTTTYNCEVTDDTGCTGTATLTVDVNQAPSIDAGADQTICDGSEVTLTGAGAGTGGTYNWDNGVSDGDAFTPNSGTTTYTLTGTDATGCENTDQVVVSTGSTPTVDAGTDLTICGGDQIILTGSGLGAGGTYSWDNGVTDGVPFTPTSDSTYTLTGANASGCEDTDQLDISVQTSLSPSFVGDTLKGCEPLTVNFTNTTNPSGLNCTWEFGDGSAGIGCSSVSHTYSENGEYDVTLSVESASGCSGTYTENNYIEVIASPTASFTPDPMVLTAGNTEVEFNNQSVNGDNYVWDFGDGSPIESTFDAVHTFPSEESGEFIITLVAFSGNTCTDTARSTIKVENEVIFYVPNSFTPDEDNFNETFQPVFTSGYDPYDFEMLIFNRWGELIFESHNADIGWDGTYGGRIAPDGTYIWKIEFKETMSDKRHNEEGHLNLLR